MIPSPPEPGAVLSARASEVLLAADRWSLWRTLTRGLVHQLANASQMLALDPAPPRARTEAVERVGVAHARLAQVHATAEPGPTLVPEVLADVQELQRLQADFPSTELALPGFADLPPVAMPPADLRHALLALVTNAKQAAGEERARVRVDVACAGDELTIVVEDAGPGLPLELGERAFEPYVTTRPERSLGLGLAVARSLARRAGGSLSASPGTARFVLRLPVWSRRT